MKFSFFKSAKGEDKKPNGSLSIEQLYEGIRSGTWKSAVLKVRSKVGSRSYRPLKEKLPGVTVSGVFKSRDVGKPVEERLIDHSGKIAIDVDGKDNPKLRVGDLIDKECLLQFISPGGKGVKIIYPCKKVRTAAEHRRIYDAAIERLAKLNVTLKADPVVKSLSNLQFVSYDPNAYYNPKTKLVLKPLPPIQRTAKKLDLHDGQQFTQLQEYVAALGTKDITRLYEDWLNVLFGLSYSFGEAGRNIVHSLCRNYPGYSESECNEKYDACLESAPSQEAPITCSTVFQLINAALPKARKKALNKLYNPNPHAIGKAEEVEATETNPDLAGFVRYGLFLFKKITDKKTNEIVDLQISRLNLNAFEKLLKELGFFRYQAMYSRAYFVRIINNVVSTVDVPDVLRIVTKVIEEEGDYVFTYGEAPHRFSWEEVALKWRELRANSTMSSQITASLTHWEPNLLKDRVDTSYIPYRNGVVVVDAKNVRLVPYKELPFQVWKERILPRDFKYVKTGGMFADFWLNVFGRGKNVKERISSLSYQRALWYYGYSLQGTKRLSSARAWLLYDMKTGNNGRSGKTIIGNAIGKIRNLVVIDGKRVDLTDRFSFQTLEPWTEVVLIDDVAKGASLQPLFSMITGSTTADKKGVNPITISVKFVFTSNWILESEGSSEAGRQFVSQLEDFYVRYSKANKNTITPIVDLHGKEFFTDWDERDWSAFDSFSVRAVQKHLAEAAPEHTIVGNARILRFIQTNEEEVFFNLARAFVENAERDSEGRITVSTSLMNEAMRDANDAIQGKRAGSVIRSFFATIGAAYDGLSTARAPNGSTRNVYRIGNDWGEFDFGNYAERLGKPKNGGDFHQNKAKRAKLA